MAINLLPKEVLRQNQKQKAGKSVSYTTYGLFALSMAVLVGGALLVYNQQSQMGKLKEAQEDLIRQVAVYQPQENQLVAIKDRLETINQVIANRGLESIRDKYKLLYELMPSGVTLSQQSISDRGNSYLAQSNSSLSLRDYIKAIKNNQEFSTVILNQLSFNPASGYQVQFEIK